MEIIDYIAVAFIVLIVGAAIFYIVRAKKRGEKCVGCPYSKQCSGKCGGKCNSSKKSDDDKNQSEK